MPAFDPASPYGINAHLPSSVLLDRVAAAGIAWIRVDFNMDQIQPAPGQYNWALTDQVVQDARARGLHLYPTLAYAPPWANGGVGGTCRPTRRTGTASWPPSSCAIVTTFSTGGCGTNPT
jgi:hypothetical protein